MSYDYVITRSFAQAEAWRKRVAGGCVGGLFACKVVTFESLISDLWELHGDGRQIVDGMLRESLMRLVFDAGDVSLSTKGMALLAASCMRDAAGVAAFDHAIAAAREGASVEGLSERELAFLKSLGSYEEQLESLGFIELGAAAAALARDCQTVFPKPARVLMPNSAPLNWIEQQFFALCPQLELALERAAGDEGVGQAPEGIELRFAFPSGRLAQPGLMSDVAREAARDGDVVVVCKDPLAVFNRVEGQLTSEGIVAQLQASVPFAQTDLGRTFLAHFHCLHDDAWDAALLTDALYSPFSGFTRVSALKVDRELRGNRVATREECLSRLSAVSESFSRMQEIVSDPDASLLVGVFEEQIGSMFERGEAWQAEQFAACAALRKALGAARVIHGDVKASAAVLEHTTLPVSMQTEADGPRVLFTTASLAADREERSCAAVVIADLTAEDYPASDRGDSKQTLLSKIGLEPYDDALSRMRREFAALLRLPTNLAVLMRPLGDANAEETYPSVVLEEFIDAYRFDPSASDDIDNQYRLPYKLQVGLVERGEELLYANSIAARADESQVMKAKLSSSAIDEVDAEARQKVMPVRFKADGGAIDKPCPSPSQIEAYLECPFKWFVTRRLHAETLDEEFGAAERGTFAHKAFEQFYRRFQDEGFEKVNASNLPRARELMRDVLDELVQAQFEIDPSHESRLVYASEFERREVEALCARMVNFLDFEAQMLPTFKPAYFEFEITPDNAVDYAGCKLVGTVDRIDVDGCGNAVIIDYKGSINSEHEIGGKSFEHAGKVQTRIYAQAVQRALGLRIVGALYVSYGEKPALAGAYDSRVLEAAHLPSLNCGKCACGLLDELPCDGEEHFLSELSFQRMLDATEEIAARAVESMAAGDIGPHPSHDKACAYCPVLACPNRGA